MSRLLEYIAVPDHEPIANPAEDKKNPENFVVTNGGDQVAYTFTSPSLRDHKPIFAAPSLCKPKPRKKKCCCISRTCLLTTIISIVAIVVIIVAVSKRQPVHEIDPTSPDYFLYGRSFEALQFMSDLEKSFDSPQYGLPHRHGCHRGQDSHNRSPVYDDNDPVLQENHQELPIPSSHHPHDEMHKTVNSANYNTVSKTKTLTFLPTKLFNLDIFVGGGFSKGAGQVEIRQSTEPTQELAIVNVTILSTSEDLLDSIDIADTEDWSTFYTAIRSTYRKKQQHDCSRKRDFLSYKIDIVFPPNLDYFDTLKLQLRQANSIQVKELETVFQTFSIGVARGDIALDRLVAYNIHLGALHGNITGNYTPRTSFIAVAARGSTDITLLPHGYVIDAIAIAVQGSSSVFLPVDGFRGLFDVGQATTGRERLVYVLEQSDIDFYEVGKKRVTGSFKDDTRSNVIVRSQDGQATLSFI